MSEKEAFTISSPIRVTPERESGSGRRERGDRGVRRHVGDKDRLSGKTLSVRDRLFVSRKTIIG